MTSNLSSASKWLERNPGQLLLTIYEPRRRWYGRLQSQWTLEWRYGVDVLDAGEFCITIAEGWREPCWSLTEIRLAGVFREWLS